MDFLFRISLNKLFYLLLHYTQNEENSNLKLK